MNTCKNMLSYTEIENKLKSVYKKYGNVRVGVAGSYANNTAKDSSDVDIVIDGDSMRMDIEQYIRSLFSIPVDVLWLELLEEDDRRLDELALSIGIPQNKYSVYKTIMEEVKWV